MWTDPNVALPPFLCMDSPLLIIFELYIRMLCLPTGSEPEAIKDLMEALKPLSYGMSSTVCLHIGLTAGHSI